MLKNTQSISVASHDNFVDIYSTSQWTRVGRCSGNSSFITHIDWSTDSELLMTNSGAYEHLFFKPPKGTQVQVNSKKIKELNWATWTGVLGEHIAGIWPKYSDGTDVNSTDRSHNGELLATGN
jgi:hypothetical protein